LYVFGGIEFYLSDESGQWEEALSDEMMILDLLKSDGHTADWQTISTPRQPPSRANHIAVSWNECLYV